MTVRDLFRELLKFPLDTELSIAAKPGRLGPDIVNIIGIMNREETHWNLDPGDGAIIVSRLGEEPDHYSAQEFFDRLEE